MNNKPQWSRLFKQCIRCNETEREHFAKGLCRRCYLRDYNANNPEKVKELRKKWWVKMGGVEYSKLKREEFHYAGNRSATLARDGFKCTICGNTSQLVVHHKDGNGRPKRSGFKNNSLDNLVTVCRACHVNIHRIEIQGISHEKRSIATKLGWATRRKRKQTNTGRKLQYD